MSETGVSSPTESATAEGSQFITPSHGRGRIAPWQKGQRGNPSGKTGTYLEVQRICRDASPHAARRIVELLDETDSRVALMAARECMDRGVGKVRENSVEEPRTLNLSALSDDQQRQLLMMLKLAMGM